jgi:hypothetical protein
MSKSLSIAGDFLSLIASQSIFPKGTETVPAALVQTQATTVFSFQYAGGALMAGDRRATAGNVIVNDGCHSQSGGIVGGQIGSEPLQLIRVYPEGRFVVAGTDRPVHRLGISQIVADERLDRDTSVARRAAWMDGHPRVRQRACAEGRTLALAVLAASIGHPIRAMCGLRRRT